MALGFIKTKNYYFLTSLDKIQKKIVSKNYDTNFFSITIKVLDANKLLLDQKTIEKDISESSYFVNKTIGALGLTNLEDIYRVSFSGEACGIPSLYYYFGWNRNKLIELPEKYEVGDAGLYYHSENLVFPKELGGKLNLIIKKVEDAVNADETSNSDSYIFNVTTFTETYQWTGEKTFLLKKSKPKKSVRNDN